MRVYVRSVLDCSPLMAWNEVRKSSLLIEVMYPIARIEPVDRAEFPDRWVEGETVRCRSYLFGALPLGTRTIFLERIDHSAHEIQSRESDLVVHRWDHLIRIEATAVGQTLYSDSVEIEAGLLTLPVWLFASLFYRHRQRRWRRVARATVGSGCRALTDVDILADTSDTTAVKELIGKSNRIVLE